MTSGCAGGRCTTGPTSASARVPGCAAVLGEVACEHAGALAVVDAPDREEVRPVTDAEWRARASAGSPGFGSDPSPRTNWRSGADTEPAVHEGGFRVGLEDESARRGKDVAEHGQPDRRLVVRGRMHDRPRPTVSIPNTVGS